MESNATPLTARYAEVLDAVIATITPLDAAALSAPCVAERCSVAALACHIAVVHGNVASFVQAIVAGEALPEITEADLESMNAENAQQNSRREKDEVLTEVRANGENLATVLQGLSAEDLERTAPFTLFGGDVSVQILVEQAVLAHTQGHLASIKAAVAAA